MSVVRGLRVVDPDGLKGEVTRVVGSYCTVVWADGTHSSLSTATVSRWSRASKIRKSVDLKWS